MEQLQTGKTVIKKIWSKPQIIEKSLSNLQNYIGKRSKGQSDADVILASHITVIIVY